MDSNYVVSVIIPLFNSQDYLDRCLNSVVNQTYSNLDIILVNDGSTDQSLSICKEWEQKDDRVRVITQDNAGQGSARNRGVQESKGDYLLFVDSDDYIHPQMVSVLLGKAIKYHAGIVQCGYAEVPDNAEVPSLEAIIEEDVKCSVDCDKSKRVLCGYTEDIISCNKLIDTNLIKPHRFPIGMYYEDKHLMFRMRYYADVIVSIDAKLYYYVQTASSTMRRPWDDKRFISSFRLIRDLSSFCIENGLQENYKSEVSGALRKLLSLYYHAASDGAFAKYKDECMDMIKQYLPDMKDNKYVIGKYKILVACMSVSVEATLAVFYTINRIRLTVLRIK